MRVIVTAVSLAALAACSVSVGDDDGKPGLPAQGTGDTRTYAVDGFTGVDLRGSDDVDVRVGPGFSVRADGDAAVLDKLKIWKDGTTLHIGRVRSTGWSFGGHHARISVTLPQLAQASIAGSGDMRIDRVQGATFKGDGAGSGHLAIDALQVERADLSLAGSGDIKVAGTARRIGLNIAGSGDIDGSGLTASQADVSIAGSGSVRANVDGPAKVSIMGSGDVALGGKAQCQTTKMGSGSVRCG